MSKKKGADKDSGPPKSLLVPVPVPSSFQRWSADQAVAEPDQRTALGEYTLTGDFLRDYLFLCTHLFPRFEGR